MAELPPIDTSGDEVVTDGDALVDVADARLRRAKRAGRNRVVGVGEDDVATCVDEAAQET